MFTELEIEKKNIKFNSKDLFNDLLKTISKYYVISLLIHWMRRSSEFISQMSTMRRMSYVLFLNCQIRAKKNQ